MLISVIISAYNRKEFLKNAIRSVYSQLLDKRLYEVVIVKNFEDKDIDGYIAKLGYKNIVYDTPSYGEQISVGIEESKGEILAFLEDDDEFKQEKLSKIYNVFSTQKEVSYFHDTREYIYNDKIVDINTKDPKINWIIRFLEEITPHEDVLINPFDKRMENFLIKYYGTVATVSLMAVRRSCIEDKLALLKQINIGVEDFIPAFAAEYGKLFHTADRLTRYRIHNKNSSIALNEKDTLRTLFYFMRFINDGKIIINNISPKNRIRSVIKMRLLRAKLILYNSPEEIKEN
ncbi:glycosyltransferase family 2 protein [Saccharolobus islandicus]|uniref:Glycosyltransferases involved in cell wall biogenesis n=1 Tax=Saccharolobus islandicus LAL14/1 TaxID=1241935 RepID=M9U5H7_SACIS|nr:glycosyltransferase [Sulfolobus islandicus]AGJ62264.1 Glycosyltransferases involved in cell wall biogenesis [Sulfolobus islandicus LAL14/1]